MRKRSIIAFVVFAFIVSSTYAQAQKYSLLLSGASFASPSNGWFELGCEQLDAQPVNRAVGGEAIANTANRMIDGSLYSREELERLDAFVIMQVHNQDVLDQSQLLENYSDYRTPFDRSNYAAAFDFVIKKFQTDCFNLKFDEKSKYFGSSHGKPAVIVLCTHWHDSRPLYNHSVRKLAEKWGLPVVEFDRYIGFSKNQLHPVTKEQHSRIYSGDKQEIDGIVYGWHALQGKDKYIQQRMAAIFTDMMKRILTP